MGLYNVLAHWRNGLRQQTVASYGPVLGLATDFRVRVFIRLSPYVWDELVAMVARSRCSSSLTRLRSNTRSSPQGWDWWTRWWKKKVGWWLLTCGPTHISFFFSCWLGCTSTKLAIHIAMGSNSTWFYKLVDQDFSYCNLGMRFKLDGKIRDTKWT